MQNVRQKLLNKAKRQREITERTEKRAIDMRNLLQAILDAYNYGENQPHWDDIVVLLSEIDGESIKDQQ